MSQREDLEELRVVLREALLSADAAVKAQIAGQLRAVIKDLASLPAAVVEVTPADDIAARRAARLAGTHASVQPPRRGQSRRRGGGNPAG